MSNLTFPFKLGDRVRLVATMKDDPNPIKAGDEGIINFINFCSFDHTTQIGIQWNSGRTLMALYPIDKLVKI